MQPALTKVPRYLHPASVKSPSIHKGQRKLGMLTTYPCRMPIFPHLGRSQALKTRLRPAKAQKPALLRSGSASLLDTEREQWRVPQDAQRQRPPSCWTMRKSSLTPTDKLMHTRRKPQCSASEMDVGVPLSNLDDVAAWEGYLPACSR